MPVYFGLDKFRTADHKLILTLSIFIIFVFWAIYANISQHNLDPYKDMLENFSWGIRWQWGNSNHPPLFGWITAAWFEIFPRTNLSYRFLASLNICVSLVLMLLISKRYLDNDQQILALAVAFALPLLGFMSITYNANSAMLPFWAAVFLFYIRILKKPRLLDGVALGVLAGLAILAKYYSAVLLLAIFIHSIADAEARKLWRGPILWAAGAFFVVTVSPHLVWLTVNRFSSVRFAIEDQGGRDVGNILFYQAEFFLAQIAYAVPGLLVLGLCRRPGDRLPAFDLAQFGSLYKTPAGRALLAVGLLPIPLTMILGLAFWVPLTSNWSVPCFIFTPILLVLLLPKRIANRRWWTGPAFILFFSVLLLALSPIIRSVVIAQAGRNTVLPIREIAIKAEALWNKESGTTLAYVGGDPELSYGSSFYSAARPFSIDGSDFVAERWINPDDVRSKGFMILCRTKRCTRAQLAAGDSDFSTTLVIPAIEGAGGPTEYEVHAFLYLPRSA